MIKILKSKHYVTFRYAIYFLIKKNFSQLSDGLAQAIAADAALLYISTKDKSLIDFSQELSECVAINNLLFSEALPDKLISTIGINIPSIYITSFEVYGDES